MCYALTEGGVILLKGIKVKECRIAAGLTQAELAARAGTAVGTIQQYELGIRQPRLDQLSRIADALDVTILDLLEMTEGSSQEEEQKKSKPEGKKSKSGARKRKTDSETTEPDSAKSKTVEKKGKSAPQNGKTDDTKSVREALDNATAAADKAFREVNTHSVTRQINTIAHDELNTVGKVELLKYALILCQSPDYAMPTEEEAPTSEALEGSEEQ